MPLPYEKPNPSSVMRGIPCNTGSRNTRYPIRGIRYAVSDTRYPIRGIRYEASERHSQTPIKERAILNRAATRVAFFYIWHLVHGQVLIVLMTLAIIVLGTTVLCDAQNRMDSITKRILFSRIG